MPRLAQKSTPRHTKYGQNSITMAVAWSVEKDFPMKHYAQDSNSDTFTCQGERSSVLHNTNWLSSSSKPICQNTKAVQSPVAQLQTLDLFVDVHSSLTQSTADKSCLQNKMQTFTSRAEEILIRLLLRKLVLYAKLIRKICHLLMAERANTHRHMIAWCEPLLTHFFLQEAQHRLLSQAVISGRVCRGCCV